MDDSRARTRQCTGKGLGVLLIALSVLALGACETVKPKIKVSGRMVYAHASALQDNEQFSEAIEKFKQVVDENPGTTLGTFAYLRLGDLHAQKKDWMEAENYYRLFLTANASSHLTSSVLFKLARAHHLNSFSGVFVKSREIDRDMEPNRQLMREYTRFYFLYPKSIYLERIRGYYREGREALAEHERMVADWYYGRELYNAAAGRYHYLLRNYPTYKGWEEALEMLISSYRLNQQPEFAEELEGILALERENGTAGNTPGAASNTAAAQ